jgi:hypothetical protein
MELSYELYLYALHRYQRKKGDLRRMRRKQKRCGRGRESTKRNGRRPEISGYVFSLFCGN